MVLESQLPHKIVNLLFQLVIVNDDLTTTGGPSSPPVTTPYQFVDWQVVSRGLGGHTALDPRVE